MSEKKSKEELAEEHTNNLMESINIMLETHKIEVTPLFLKHVTNLARLHIQQAAGDGFFSGLSYALGGQHGLQEKKD